MTLNKKMADLLSEIRRNEKSITSSSLEISSPNVGDNLINLYMQTRSFKTRELITMFMIEAGYDWLRKLVMRDVQVMVA